MLETIIVLFQTVLKGHTVPQHPSQVLLNVGACAVLKPQPGLKFDPMNIVKIEQIKNGQYVYRWWTIQQEWAIDTNDQLGEFTMFHRNFQPVKCPD